MKQDPNAPESLQAFQIAYGRYLRNPQSQTRPRGIPARRSEIYEELFFNNVCGFVNACFPVAAQCLGEALWAQLSREFFTRWRCDTPIFSQIPYEFVRFCSDTFLDVNTPKWLPELLHYEWVELDVDLDESHLDLPEQPGVMRLNPSARLLAYEWPVHTITATHLPSEGQPTFLVVYRGADFSVRFSELNSTTYLLLEQLVAQEVDAAELVHQFLEKHPQLDADAVKRFAPALLQQFVESGVILRGGEA